LWPGAAVQAGHPRRRLKNVLSRTPLSLASRPWWRRRKNIPRNSTIPRDAQESFTTAVEITGIDIHVLQANANWRMRSLADFN